MSSPSTPNSHPHSTALQSTKRSALFLLDPASHPAPTRLRTRTAIRTLRYILIFAFWRLVRYAKYAAVGAITAGLAGTALGTATAGVGFVLAPPGILVGAGVGLLWGVAKFGWRTAAARVRSGKVDGADARGDERRDGKGEEEEVRRGTERVTGRVEPW